MLRLLKSLLQSALIQRDRAVIYRPGELSRRAEAILQPDLTMLLAELTLRSPDPVIVQVGAFDGTTDDPISTFLQHGDARSILFEPQPDPFAKLQAKYIDNPRVVAVNAAIAPRDGTYPLFVVDGSNPDDPPWCSQIASMSRDHVLRHANWVPDLANRIRQIDVPAISPRTLMTTYDLERIDALIVDAEGADWDLVKLFLAEGVIPSVLQFEWKHLSGATRSAAIAELADLDFQMAVCGADVIARRVFTDQSRSSRLLRDLPAREQTQEACHP